MFKPNLMSENLNGYKKYAVPVPLPQPDVQPNTINFVQNFLYNLDLLPKSILPTLGNTDDLKDKHIHWFELRNLNVFQKYALPVPLPLNATKLNIRLG